MKQVVRNSYPPVNIITHLIALIRYYLVNQERQKADKLFSQFCTDLPWLNKHKKRLHRLMKVSKSQPLKDWIPEKISSKPEILDEQDTGSELSVAEDNSSHIVSAYTDHYLQFFENPVKSRVKNPRLFRKQGDLHGKFIERFRPLEALALESRSKRSRYAFLNSRALVAEEISSLVTQVTNGV